MISVEYTITDLNKLIYNFAFDYLKKKYIKVSSKNITTGVVTKYTYGVDYVVVDSTIELLHTVGAVGDVLRIIRETSTSEQIVSWNDASILKASDISLAQLQQLHILEEYSEHMSTNSLSLDINGQYDAKNSRIVNLSAPQTATDAVNKDYVDTIMGTLTTAQQSITLSQSWAIGDIVNRPEGSAKYWAERAYNIRKNNIAYTLGDVAYSPSLPSWVRLDCIQGGTTSSTEPNWGIVTEGQEVTDGRVKWRVSNVRNVFPKVSTYGYHYRDVAGYSTSGSGANTIGTLKITLPTSWLSTMLKIKIEGFNYVSGGGNWGAELQGYNTSSAWFNTSAILSPNCPFTSVRFGHDGTKCCILLGTTSTVWQYPHITISDVYASYSGYNQYDTGWSLSFITNETGITMSSTPSVKTLVDATRTDIFAPAGYGLGGIATPLSSVDLNTVQYSGFYFAYSNCTNQPPVGGTYHLIVQGGGSTPQNFSQIAMQYNTGVTYTRTCFVGTWSAWKQLATTDNPSLTGTVTLGGGQLKFPATQVASTDPNTLDDYEEGTWTPTLYGSTTAGSYTLSSINVQYTKIGNIVHVFGGFNVTVASAGAGGATIGGLPFAKATNSNAVGSIQIAGCSLTEGFSISFTNATSAVNTLGVYKNAGASQVLITSITTGNIYLSITYKV